MTSKTSNLALKLRHRLNIVMEMRLESLKRSVDLKLHDKREIRQVNNLASGFIIENRALFRDMDHTKGVHPPHFAQQAVTDTDVRAFGPQVYQ